MLDTVKVETALEDTFSKHPLPGRKDSWA